jgi:hypothetical protein
VCEPTGQEGPDHGRSLHGAGVALTGSCRHTGAAQYLAQGPGKVITRRAPGAGTVRCWAQAPAVSSSASASRFCTRADPCSGGVLAVAVIDTGW